MIVIQANFPVGPDQHEQATELMQTLAAQSRSETGILEYRVTTDIEEPHTFRFFELYEDEAAFGTHGETDHFEEFEAALPELLADEPSVTRYDVDSATDLEL